MAHDHIRVFREAGGQIFVQKGDKTLTCTVKEFLTLEPEYQALPAGMAWREWTPERQCLSDGTTQRGDDLDGSLYVNKVAAYINRLTAYRWTRKTAPALLDSAYYSTQYQEDTLL